MAQDNPTTPMQFCDALQCLSRVKGLLALLLVLCLLVQVTAFILVDFVGVADGAAKMPSAAAAPAEAEPDAETDAEIAVDSPAEAQAGNAGADTWFEVISLALAATKFVGVVSAGLLMLTLMFAVKISLIGGVGATEGFLGAFFWSLILLAMLVPWQQIIGSALACGATFNMSQLVNRTWGVHTGLGADEATGGLLRQGMYYARFLAYPILTLLVEVLVLLKFARGFRPLKEDALGAAPAAPPAAAPAESSPIQI
jgi:hypothetical protein